MTTLQYRVSTPVEARDTLQQLYHGAIHPHTKHGAAGIVTWQTENKALRQKMRGKLHLYLRFISEAVWFRDEHGRYFRYALLAWKELFKNQFLEPVIEEKVNKRTGEITFKARRLSTEELSDDAFDEFLTAVEAFIQLDLDLELPEEGY